MTYIKSLRFMQRKSNSRKRDMLLWAIGIFSLAGLDVQPSSAEVIYNAVTDFSISNNTETSVWSYRYSDDLLRDGVYTLANVPTAANTNYSPALPSWGVFQGVGRNNPAFINNWFAVEANPTIGGLPVIPASTMYLHPGGPQSDAGTSLGLVVVSWRSPGIGKVNIDYSFRGLLPGTGVNYYVELNSQSNTLVSGFASSSSFGSGSLTNISVGLGDRINFLVDPAGNANADTTGFQGIIRFQAVPEPNSLAYLVVVGSWVMSSRTRADFGRRSQRKRSD